MRNVATTIETLRTSHPDPDFISMEMDGEDKFVVTFQDRDGEDYKDVDSEAVQLSEGVNIMGTGHSLDYTIIGYHENGSKHVEGSELIYIPGGGGFIDYD